MTDLSSFFFALTTLGVASPRRFYSTTMHKAESTFALPARNQLIN